MKYPTPVGGYLEVVGRLLDVVFGALAQAIPQRTPAASFGTTGVTTVGGRHPRTGRYYVAVFPYPGGYGGYQGGDGLVHGVTPQSMANFMSIEMSEHRYPVRFKHFALREDSAGAGEFRGGCGTTYSFEPWSDCLVSVLGDRVDHVPFGVAGGKSAAPNEVKYRSGNEEVVPALRSKYEKQPMKAGDLVMNSSCGSGASAGQTRSRMKRRAVVCIWRNSCGSSHAPSLLCALTLSLPDFSGSFRSPSCPACSACTRRPAALRQSRRRSRARRSRAKCSRD